jgi:predicted nucleotidyltransferase
MQALEQQKLNTVLSDFVADCRTVFGDKLNDVRLFGSYARGDHNEESDIDVMVILDMSDAEVRKGRYDICHIAATLELKYCITISPVLYGKEEYNIRKTFGFCKNVEVEGVSQYAGQAYA